MPKLDLKKERKELFSPPSKEVVVVDVPDMNFAMIDGQGNPNTSQEYQDALQALYGVSFTLKFMIKKEDPVKDYTVMPLEGLWWTDEMTGKLKMEDLDKVYWTSMMMQPEHITEDMFLEALEELKQKKPNPSLEKLRFERFHEGLSVQIMHLGPYSEEPRSLAKMEAYIEEHGYRYRGDHHEIYLGDPRRAKPENLKTVLRHPVEKAS